MVRRAGHGWDFLVTDSPTIKDGLSGPKTVLVLEDDAGVRDSIMKWLVGREFQVLECARPDEALGLVQSTSDAIDVAVVDMVMPVMWGDDFARRLAEISPETKVIFISGHSEEFLKSSGSLTDRDIFFAKPYSPKGLLHKIRELLGIEVPVAAAGSEAEQPAATVAQEPLRPDPHFAGQFGFHIENDQPVN